MKILVNEDKEIICIIISIAFVGFKSFCTMHLSIIFNYFYSLRDQLPNTQEFKIYWISVLHIFLYDLGYDGSTSNKKYIQ